jgi:hypothetical protein
MEVGMHYRPRKPTIAIHALISLEADEARRRLQGRLGISVPKLIERALAALDRELEAAGSPAE